MGRLLSSMGAMPVTLGVTRRLLQGSSAASGGENMIEMSKNLEAQASLDDVWKIISDLDNEHKTWPFLKDVRILSKTDNSVEREVKIRRGPMGEAKSLQTLVVDSARKTTTLTMTKGPILGVRKIVLAKMEDGRTEVQVIWEFEMKGVPGFAIGFVKDNISEVTEKALEQIAEQAKHSVAE
jgi:carbon monoxide dehydrogenase subunit G